MSAGNIEWSVKVTHEPTGMSQTITSRDMRSYHKAKERAIKILTSKVNYAKMVDTIKDCKINT